MINGAITQEVPFISKQKNGCKLCGELGTDKHMAIPVYGVEKAATYEKMAQYDNRCWLWERGMVSFPGASVTERMADIEQAIDRFGKLGPKHQKLQRQDCY